MNGKPNPKNYPYWPELIAQLNYEFNESIIQIGIEGEVQLVDDFRPNLPMTELTKLLHSCQTWISCDSFFQHLAWLEGKSGIVLWSVSDPLIFGHPENINLLKDRANLAKDQFLWWEDQEYQKDAFIHPNEVIKNLKLL
jgi:ADP-heptose:LPS heptosyltransferase